MTHSLVTDLFEKTKPIIYTVPYRSLHLRIREDASFVAAQDCSRAPYELKNGETYNGHLVNCDTWMNIHLREVICTSKDGDRFWRMPECYIRGNTIKYLRVPDEVIDKVQEEKTRTDRKPPGVGRGRGRGIDDVGGRGRGRGGSMGKMGGNKGPGRGRG